MKDPYVFEIDGEFAGIVFNPSGGQPGLTIDEAGTQKVKQPKPVSFTVGMGGNDPIWDMILGALYRKERKGGTYAMYSVQKGILIPQVDTTSSGSSFQEFSTGRVQFPGCDVGGGEPAGVIVSGQPTIIENKKDFVVPKEKVKVAVKQKMFFPGNFRLTVPGMPTGNVQTIDPITCVRVAVGDVNGDGTPDFAFVPGELNFTVPQIDAAPYYRAFAEALVSKEEHEHEVRLEYRDEFGNAMLTLTMSVSIRAVGPENMFSDVDNPSNNVKVYHKIKRELLVERERKG